MTGKQYQADYLRISMEDGDIISNENKAESDSIAHQRGLIAQYRKEKKLYPEAEVLEFVDDGYSGTSFERPAVKRLLSLVREGKICCVVVKDLSRFGRNYLEVSDYLEQIFPFLGVRFISINDGYDSDDYIGTTGGIEIALKNLLYDMYSKDLSEKMRSALAVRRKRGDYIGPKPPFGYRFSENKKVLEPDPEAVPYVKRVFELACTGCSTGEIAKKLNEEQIPTPGQYKNREKVQYHMLDGAGYWNRKTVLQILQNKVYLGSVVNGKSRVTRIGGKQFKNVPDEERIYLPNKHTAIISESEFERAAKVIRYRGEQRGKKHQSGTESILQGKLRCGNCKRSLVRITCTAVPCFICGRFLYDENSGCFPGRLKEPEAEAFVREQLAQKTNMVQGTAQDGMDETRIPQPTSASPLCNEKKWKALEQRLSSVKTEKHLLYERLKQGQIDQNAYNRQAEALRALEKELQEQEKSLREQLFWQKQFREQGDSQWDSGEGMDGCKKADAGQKNLNTTEEKLTRELVEKLVDRVYVDENGKMEVVWRDFS